MVKRNKLFLIGMTLTLWMSLFVVSCSSDDGGGGKTFPLAAEIFKSIDDKQVAFQGLTHSATSWLWDFGDGSTSNEQNPVHVYESGGFYTVTLTATATNGEAVVSEVQLALALTPYVLLTGGPTATNGKTWKLSASHSGNGDYLAWANADLDPFDPSITPLPDGAFGLFLGMGEVYDDEFTFHFDGNYSIDTKDGTAFSGVFYQFFLNGGDIVNWGGIDFGLVTGNYTPESNASFNFIEGEDFTNPSVFGAITYEGVTTIDFNDTEKAFVGFLDFQRTVIVQNITVDSMQIVIFASLDEGAAGAGGLSTNALILTLNVVN